MTRQRGKPQRSKNKGLKGSIASAPFSRRLRAYLVDCATYLGLAAATVPIGLVVYQLSDAGVPLPLIYALSAVPVFVASVWATYRENRRGQTFGHQLLGLRVERARSRGSFTSRNVVKIFIPWSAVHMVAIGAAAGGYERLDPWTIGATAVTYVILPVMLISVWRGQGLHNLIAQTRTDAA